MTKGQMEIMGLVILVALAGIVMAVALVWSVQTVDQRDTTSSFTNAIQSQRFITVLAQTKLPACDQTYQAALQNCLQEGTDLAGGRVCSDGNTTCHHVTHTGETIINDTIRKWGARYNYSIRGTTLLYNATRDCGSLDPKVEPGVRVIPVPPYTTDYEIRLDICT
jgi:hypothetical protein